MTNERLNLKYVTKKANAEWVEENPLLPIGVIAYESDTDKMKLFDGEHSFNELPYMTGNGGGEGIASGNLKSTVAFHQNSGVNKIEGNTLIVNGTFTDCQGEEFTLTNARITMPSFPNAGAYICAVSKTGEALFIQKNTFFVSKESMLDVGPSNIWFNPYTLPYKAIHSQSTSSGTYIHTDISKGYSLLFNEINQLSVGVTHAFKPLTSLEDTKTEQALVMEDMGGESMSYNNSWEWFNDSSESMPTVPPERQLKQDMYLIRMGYSQTQPVKINQLSLLVPKQCEFTSIDLLVPDEEEEGMPVIHHTFHNVVGNDNWQTLDFPLVETPIIVIALHYKNTPKTIKVLYNYKTVGEVEVSKTNFKTVYSESHNSELPNTSNNHWDVTRSDETFHTYENGWFAFSAKGLTSVDAVIVGKNYGFSFAPNANGITRFIIPCRKDDILKINFEGAITEGKLEFFNTDM